MKIQLLTENASCGLGWHAEWGFSAHIEYGGANILFDTGYSDVWIRNAATAGLDLRSLDMIALSHFHEDHTRGLLFHPFREKKRLVCHPRVLTILAESQDPEAMQDYRNIRAKLQSDFTVQTSKEPLELASGAFFLGEIPRVTSFERGMSFDDPMEDDSALAFKTDKGAVVIAGCSHAGICNIAARAKEVTGQALHAVIGGFHLLKEEDPPVDETIAWFANEKVARIFPMHCVDFEYLTKFHAAFDMPKLCAGDVIEI